MVQFCATQGPRSLARIEPCMFTRALHERHQYANHKDCMTNANSMNTTAFDRCILNDVLYGKGNFVQTLVSPLSLWGGDEI